jgi:threonine dehydratase
VISEIAGANVRLKCGNLQRAGSFKIRGAYNFVSQLSDEQVASGIITYSSGNHAQAVALSGKLRGVRAVVVMPTTAPKVKRDGAERLGAEVIYEGTTSLERRAKAEEIAEEQGLVIVPPFDHRHIIAGQGTVGLEIAREWPDVDLVLAPIGGGGLASGVAASIKRLLPAARVIGVEPVGAASMRKALDEERPVVIKKIDTIADGLAPVMAGERQVVFHSDKPVNCPVFERSELRAGHILTGPAVIAQLDATTLLYPGDVGTVDESGTLLITLTEDLN